MPRVIEAMTRVEWGDGRVVRVWSDLNARSASLHVEHEEVEKMVRRLSDDSVSAKHLAEKIADVPGVNAVEVLEAHGCGVVIYPEWP